MIYGRVVRVISDDHKPFTTLIVNNNNRNIPVKLHNDVYEKAVEENAGTLWDAEVEITEIGTGAKKKVEIQIFP